MSGDPYLWPGSTVLRNRFDLTDAAELDRLERRIVTQRSAEGVPPGQFDLAHLCAIHRHLFQDIYEWAGEIRTVEIAKGGNQFQFQRFIEAGMADVHSRLVRAGFLRGSAAGDFARQAGEILGDINYVHPFREGNGRAQLQYLRLLAGQAGHPLALERLDPAGWIAASRAAHAADYGPMAREIARILAP